MEDQITTTNVFQGILTLAAQKLQERGEKDEAALLLSKVPKPIGINLDEMLTVGYRIEGIPDAMWEILL